MIEEVKLLLQKSHVVLPKTTVIKQYHHRGIKNFNSTGAVFIQVVAHEYCKFIVVLLPGQSYPIHYHRIKDESFFILFGELNVKLEDEVYNLMKGDILNIPRRFNHSFSTKEGCVFEEISTAYLQNDSVYNDMVINNIPKSDQLTLLSADFMLL